MYVHYYDVGTPTPPSPALSTASREQRLATGSLLDVSMIASDAGFSAPVAISNVWEEDHGPHEWNAVEREDFLRFGNSAKAMYAEALEWLARSAGEARRGYDLASQFAGELLEP